MYASELEYKDVLFVYGGMVSMALDHKDQIFYVLHVLAKDAEGTEQTLNLAIPPMATDRFINLVKQMEVKNEE